MQSLKAVLPISAMLLLGAAAKAQPQCEAPASWFPHKQIHESDFHAPEKDCAFHQWSWQTFLWLTKPTGNDRILLLDLPTAKELLQPGKAPAELDTQTGEPFKNQPLILTPRVLKHSAPTKFLDIRQAGSRGI